MQNRKFTLLAVVFTASLFLALGTAFADELLRLKFEEGDVLTYKLVNDSSQEQMGMKMANKETRTMQFKVQKVEDELATIEVTVTRVQVDSENPMMGKTQFDTAKEPAGEESDVGFFRIMVDTPFTLVLDSRGIVKSVSGFSEIGRKILDHIKKSMEGNPGAAMQMKMFEKMFTDEAMGKQIGMLLVQLPEESVTKGTAWKDESVMTLPPPLGDLIMKTDYSATSVADGLVAVSFKGTVEMGALDESSVDPNDPMAAMIKMMKVSQGKHDGNLAFDYENGRLLKRTVNTTMTMSIMGQEIPIVQNQTMELVEPEVVAEEAEKVEEEAKTE